MENYKSVCDTCYQKTWYVPKTDGGKCRACSDGTLREYDLTGLTPQLLGREGDRVEVVTTYGEKRRFIVGKSMSWKPCHLELFNRRASGGISAEKVYTSVQSLYKVR